MGLFDRRSDLERLRDELRDLDLDLNLHAANAREVERKRTPGAGFGTEKGIDEAVAKIGRARADLLARRAKLAPAVESLERLEAARSKLPAILAAAGLPADVTEARAALDPAVAEALAAEQAARRLHDYAKAAAAQAEAATRNPLPSHDPTRAGRLRALADARYRAALAAHHAVESLAAAALALDELAALEAEAAQALANLDAKPAKKAAA